MEPHYLQHLTGGSDKDAILRDLMNQYGNDVWNFAFFLTRRSDAADDLSQDVFLSVYDKLYSFRGECSVKSWLLTITRNKSLNYLKSAFISKVTLVDYVIRRGSSRSAEEELFDRLETRHIWVTLMRIPRKFREILLLNAHYELTNKEISALLDIPEATVKTRLHRARNKLSDMLKKEKQEGE
ncbi:RNA polymerase sigma-70 factor, ECF subfamily [Paenibacillus sp. 1_12]|uniref:RNA polymerase sigma factor n=1 Tax=Paenibacillus sp. 1_12 TaxID=1566278 RepID=UPI0008E0781B|nr:sigma-70 family RNA polymerase sigma factor [Paenibacillus sp. 1_12]SFL74955.1 RNA polymerase sigma-70 factor, ECF subfamily [Paenibacillus sp. 1_12]